MPACSRPPACCARRPTRTFFTVTLPGARYGLISAAFVVFTLTITDFGVPKVVGGDFSVLAVDIYKQVVGQQNFAMGAVVSVVLLIPAVLAFVVDRMVTARQVALLSARAVPYQPSPNRPTDRMALIYCCVVAGLPSAHRRHFAVRLADAVLAVQSQPVPAPLQLRRRGRRRLGVLR